jgi:hypothetical protein
MLITNPNRINANRNLFSSWIRTHDTGIIAGEASSCFMPLWPSMVVLFIPSRLPLYSLPEFGSRQAHNVLLQYRIPYWSSACSINLNCSVWMLVSELSQAQRTTVPLYTQRNVFEFLQFICYCGRCEQHRKCQLVCVCVCVSVAGCWGHTEHRWHCSPTSPSTEPQSSSPVLFHLPLCCVSATFHPHQLSFQGVSPLDPTTQLKGCPSVWQDSIHLVFSPSTCTLTLLSIQTTAVLFICIWFTTVAL